MSQSHIERFRTQLATTTFAGELKMNSKYHSAISNSNPLLDKLPHLITFQNGTLNFKTNEFRPSRPDYYLTSTLAVQYREPTAEELKDLNEYLSELFVDPDIKSCVLRFISRMLYGKNKNSKLLIFTGDSGNGKTAFMELLGLMFSLLFITWPTAMLKEETKASRVTPELERVRYGAIIVSIPEPGSDLVIMSSIVKRITGSDKMHFRELFGKGKDMKTCTPNVHSYNLLQQSTKT